MHAGIMVLNAREGGPAFKAGLQGTSRDEYGRLVLVGVGGSWGARLKVSARTVIIWVNRAPLPWSTPLRERSGCVVDPLGTKRLRG